MRGSFHKPLQFSPILETEEQKGRGVCSPGPSAKAAALHIDVVKCGNWKDSAILADWGALSKHFELLLFLLTWSHSKLTPSGLNGVDSGVRWCLLVFH